MSTYVDTRSQEVKLMWENQNSMCDLLPISKMFHPFLFTGEKNVSSSQQKLNQALKSAWEYLRQL